MNEIYNLPIVIFFVAGTVVCLLAIVALLYAIRALRVYIAKNSVGSSHAAVPPQFRAFLPNGSDRESN